MNESLAVYLELAAAKSKQLAVDYKAGKLWEGDLQRGTSEVIENMRKALSLSRESR